MACAGRVGAGADALAEAATAAAERGLHGEEVVVLHDLVRLGRARSAVARLEVLATTVQGPLVALARDHARASVSGDGAALDAICERAVALGLILIAVDAAAQAERAHDEVGMRARSTASRRRCRALLAACEGATTPAVREQESDVRLTERERDIAELAARGITDKEIAVALGISARTVMTHLARVYAKLGAGGRRELAGLLGASTVFEQ
jgi:DNA-binding CsgD family transcriptional regulator